MSGQVVKVKARTIRAVTFLPHGQRCETWLPAGLWQVVCGCELTGGRDGTELSHAIMVRKPVPLTSDGIWYTGANAFSGN